MEFWEHAMVITEGMNGSKFNDVNTWILQKVRNMSNYFFGENRIIEMIDEFVLKTQSTISKSSIQ